MNNLSCGIVRDLLPLYCDGLCSEENSELIRSHLDSCAECRRLAESPKIAENTENIPDKATAMLKLNRTIKKTLRSRLIAWIILFALLIPAALLGANNYIRIEGLPSFDTIIANHDAKKIAEMITEKNFETLVSRIDTSSSSNGTDKEFHEYLNAASDSEHSAKADDIKFISQTYDALIGDAKAEKISVRSGYSNDMYETPSASPQILSTISISYSNDIQLEFSLIKNYGWYTLSCDSYDDTYDSTKLNDFADSVNFMYKHEKFSSSQLTNEFTYTEPMNDASIAPRDEMTAYFFRPEYRDAAVKMLNECAENGYSIPRCYFSCNRYDTEKNTLYYDAVFIVQDKKGSAVIETRFDHNFMGLEPTGISRIYNDGCSDELIGTFSDFLGK
ncbi:MAG: zf-HC2 domain-containing protein [Ruminococcus sp.]|nr:zf-HC2 domain-containing protein [Ruminococcus sp.]